MDDKVRVIHRSYHENWHVTCLNFINMNLTVISYEFIKMLRRVNLIVIILMIFSCHGNTSENLPLTGSDEKPYEVYVIQDFWHTGIVFNVKDINPEIWPEIERYQRFNYVDTGWGDEKFYQAAGNPFFLGARAMLWPTRSVLQVFAFSTRLRSAYGMDSRILRIPVTGQQLDDLTRFVAERYMRDDAGNIIPSTVHGEARFYFLATGKYHLFRTCNTWVAKGFKQSGFDVGTFMVLNANSLYRELTRIPGVEFID
jgi:uncharacterized protein (TIGR02117 family)